MNEETKKRISDINNGIIPDGYKKTKVGIVPVEWEISSLDKFIVEHIEKSTENNQYPVLTSSRKGIFLQSDYYNKQVASEDNTGYNIVPFGYFTYRHMSDDEIFRFNINNIVEKGIVSTLYPVFTTKNLDDNWLLNTLNYGSSFHKYSLIQKQGGSRTYMYLEKLKKLKLAFPPLPEQQKIAEILSAQDKLIELKQKLIDQKKQQKKWLMQNLLTCKVRLKGFEGEWKKKSLNSICDCLDSLRKPLSGEERSKIQGEYPYYGANGIVDYINDYIFDGKYILLAEDGGHFEDYSSKPIAMYVKEKCWVNNHAHILKVNSEYSDLFVFYSLQHKDIRNYINGSTRQKLTQNDMMTIMISMPTDKLEQTAIGEILSAQDKEIELMEKELELQKQKKKALMQLLLTGKVRVKL